LVEVYRVLAWQEVADGVLAEIFVEHECIASAIPGHEVVPRSGNNGVGGRAAVQVAAGGIGGQRDRGSVGIDSGFVLQDFDRLTVEDLGHRSH
jgi:hypothetical protein